LLLLLLYPQHRVFLQSELYRSDQGRVTFTSKAPLELIQATSDELRGILNPSDNKFAFSIDISSFLGFNSTLQRTHFNENYLESSKFPTASFAGKIIEPVDWSQPGLIEVRAKGILKIHNVAHERIIRGEIHKEEGTLNVISTFTIPLSDHNINIPKIVVQKISDVVKVDVKLQLVRQFTVP